MRAMEGKRVFNNLLNIAFQDLYPYDAFSNLLTP